jgi:hypothetical protein
MKHLVSTVAACAIVSLSGLAQTESTQLPTSSTQVPQAQPAPINNGQNYQLGTGGLTYSNRLGQTFSADELASNLQALRAAIDQALPALAAFNEHYSNSLTAGKQTVGGTLSGIVSDVLHKNQTAGQSSTTTQTSLNTSNLLSVLGGLLNKNSTVTSGSGSTPGNAQDLVALQNDLQPVLAVLQRLNVGPSVNPVSTPNPTGVTPQTYPNGSLTPTGR